MSTQLTWTEFLTKVKSGQTWSVYFAGYQLIFFFSLAFKLMLLGSVVGYVIASIQMLIAAFILANLVAHTFYNGWKSDIPLKNFLKTMLFKRTHDIDGQIVLFGLTGVLIYLSPHYLFFLNGGVTMLGIFTGIMGLTVILVIIDLIYKKFYH